MSDFGLPHGDLNLLVVEVGEGVFHSGIVSVAGESLNQSSIRSSLFVDKVLRERASSPFGSERANQIADVLDLTTCGDCGCSR
jgi:hypothetical protein